MATLPISAQRGLSVLCEGGIARITLQRSEHRNALSQELLTALGEALEAIAKEREARVVVLAAEGPVFCSGHDLGEMIGRPEEEYAVLFATCSQMMLQLRRLPQPVIARVQGPAVAAGCQLVAACDLAVAAEGATFSTPGVKIGLFCSTPMVPLVRAVPAKAAMEMLLTGAAISAERAYQLGLVNRVVPAERLDEAVQEFTDAILAASPLIIRLGKAAFYEGLALDEATAYQRATDVMVANALCGDAQEGMSAFLQKRRPEWRGE
ncbi:MAG: enoyl-CoA hydratase [Isosphaeraceae bacterium]|nr:enoyl-CoA hydratase [Isosphaeraceae bacterium]